MTALEAFQTLIEKKRPAPNWTDTKGVYADLSSYPDVEYYVKCPKCGQVHGSYKNMREAHGKRLCDLCNVESINKLKKQVKEVDAPKNRGKPGKGTSKLFNEAAILPAPGEYAYIPPVTVYEADDVLPEPPPEDNFDPREYLLTPETGNWINDAMRELGDKEGTQFNIAQRHRNYLDDPDSAFTVDVEGDDGTEWRIYQTEDEARTEALRRVRDDLENEPGLFTQNWLENFIDMDRLKHHLSEEARDIEWLLQMSEQEQVDYLIKQSHFNQEDFYNEEGDFVPNEDLLEAGREKFVEKQVEDFDPMGWMRDVYGREEAAKEAIEAVGINYDAAAESAVNADGWAHFLSTYDGNYTEIGDAVAFRTN